jgi:hypothetical protein
MADSQVPLGGVDALSGTITELAWRSKPSWYLLTTEDRMIPPQGGRRHPASRNRPRNRSPAKDAWNFSRWRNPSRGGRIGGTGAPGGGSAIKVLTDSPLSGAKPAMPLELPVERSPTGTRVVRSATVRRGHHGRKNDGYNVAVVQNPTMSLKGDVAATNMIINAQDEPVVLVGHSYGGAVITEAGTNPNVMALVYSGPRRRPSR